MDHYIGQINVANHQSAQELEDAILLLLEGNPLLEYDVPYEYDYWYEFHDVVLYENTHGLSQRHWEEVMNMMIERINATNFFLHPIDDMPAEAHLVPIENLLEDEDPMDLPVVEDPMDLQVVEDQLLDNQA
ncbi:unnamed protein product [Prunus armeniaca]|uniref:Uncharacterized protein n=1 Tax=Prunus armeniaca TaxID=36596 RepID=A0A6J5XSI2_PRUAR|nr:hypothetical protein GBA52_024993 [Prunus armeniaca]CAB4316730.1 unnamed protein product [Prunus armeniaca]